MTRDSTAPSPRHHRAPTSDTGDAEVLRGERDLLLDILAALGGSRSVEDYLRSLAQSVRQYSGCRCVGMRLLDEYGNIPYVAYEGFSHVFYERESPLSVKTDSCMCINVVLGTTDSSQTFFTEGGSFVSNGTTRLLASIPAEDLGKTRNVCNELGLESVALIPMKHHGRILGLIHLADEEENRVPLDKVIFLEAVGGHIGQALHAIVTEEALRQSEQHYSALVSNLADAVFIFRDGRMVWCNERAQEMYGYGCDELVGREASFFYPETVSASEFVETVSAGIREKGVFRSTTDFRREDGSLIHVEYSISQISERPSSELVAIARDVTERVRAEQALRESEDRHRTLFETMLTGVVYQDADGHITSANPAAQRILGLTLEQMQGRTSTDPRWKSIHEDGSDFPGSEHPSMTALRTGREVRDVVMGVYNPVVGDYRWISIDAVPQYRPGESRPYQVFTTFDDITDSKRAGEELRASEANYRRLVESSPDGVLSIDGRMRVRECNDGVCQLLGYPRKELLGKDLRGLIGDGNDRDPALYRAELEESGILETEFELVRRDGRRLPVWAKAVGVYDRDGNLSQALMYLRDIAERQKVDQLKDEFIGLVSHELRTPLTVIMGAVHTALTEDDRLSREDRRQLLQDAASEAEALSHILGNLLELSRAQAHRLVLYVEPIAIEGVVRSAIDKVAVHHPAHRFVFKPSRKLPKVHADELRVERVLYNLLENAAKYSPNGGDVRVTIKAAEGHLKIGVSDQGVGISREDQERLFAPFQRLGDTRAEGAKGIGLGLLVCRRLVEAHGGTVWVESKRGKGSTFYFTLPLEGKEG